MLSWKIGSLLGSTMLNIKFQLSSGRTPRKEPLEICFQYVCKDNSFDCLCWRIPDWLYIFGVGKTPGMKILGWRSCSPFSAKPQPATLPETNSPGVGPGNKMLGARWFISFLGPDGYFRGYKPQKNRTSKRLGKSRSKKKNGFLREPSHKRKHRGKTCPKPIPCVYGIFTSMNTHKNQPCHVGTYSIHGWYGQTNQPKKPLTSFFFQETSLRFTKSFHTAIQVDAHTRVSSTWEASNSSKRFGRATYLLKNIQLKRLKFISTKVCHVLSFLTRFWCWNLQFYKIYSKHPCFLGSRSECIYTAQHLRKEIPLTFSRNPLKKPWPIYL